MNNSEQNLKYEQFIRRAWNCDRFQKGANTDIWESLTTSYYQSQESNNQADIVSFDKKFNTVKMYINNSFTKILESAYSENIETKIIAELSELQKESQNSSNPEQLLDSFIKTLAIMNDNSI